MPEGSGTIAAGTAIVVTVLVGIFVLAWHGTLTGVEIVGIVTSIVSIAGGILGVHVGIKAGGTAAADGVTAVTTPPPDGSGVK